MASRHSSALVLASGLAGSVTVAEANSPGRGGHGDKDKIKNVIYLLGDGMGRTHVTAARERYYGAAGKLNMERFPQVGQVSTYAVQTNSGQPGATDFVPNLVTDSASAATAWASGVKTYNAALGVDAKGKVKPTIMELAKKAGLRTGNVSTAEITDATPAGQMSHALLRGCQGPTYSASACQNTAVTGSRAPDHRRPGDPDRRADRTQRHRRRDPRRRPGPLRRRGRGRAGGAGVRRAQLALEPDRGDRGRPGRDARRKVFGLFNTGNLTIEKYKRENPDAVQAEEPSLPEMTAKAIELLAKSKSSKGFYLQVEGALIDKRSHANDAAQTLEEMRAFDQAVAVAKAFARHDGHTLVIVTADHECAGFNIIEKGSYTNAEAASPPANVDAGNTANNSTPSPRDQRGQGPGAFERDRQRRRLGGPEQLRTGHVPDAR